LIYISKASSLLLAASDNVHISETYNVVLQMKHFIISFFNSKFNLTVNGVLLSPKIKNKANK